MSLGLPLATLLFLGSDKHTTKTLYRSRNITLQYRKIWEKERKVKLRSRYNNNNNNNNYTTIIMTKNKNNNSNNNILTIIDNSEFQCDMCGR